MKTLPQSHNEQDESRKTILYVEDEEANKDVAHLHLGSRWQMVYAKNSREACRRLKELGSRLYSVLMDIQLKGSEMNGVQLTRLIRGARDANAPAYTQDVPTLDVPIIIVTAYADKFPLATLQAAGASDVLYKPIDFVKLMGAITRANLRRVNRADG